MFTEEIKRLAGGIAMMGLLACQMTESALASPHYLAFFNGLDGGPSQAYRHVVDSSLDWGQDLPELKRWLNTRGLERPRHAPVYLSYFGTAMPSFYEIDANKLPGFPERWADHVPEPLLPGVYCVSATMLQAVYLKPSGAWTPESEARYDDVVYNLRLLDSTRVNPTARAALIRQTGGDFWRANFHAYEEARLARLLAWLRHRAPDAQVGYSILIYNVSQDDLAHVRPGTPI